MNLNQAQAVVKLLRDARHPPSIDGADYTDDEMAEFGEPSISVKHYHAARDGGPETMEVELLVDHRLVELYLSLEGSLWTWSTIRIPAEDLDCECPGPPESKVDRSSCPVHSDSTRELDCFRDAAVVWRIDGGSWRLQLLVGEPVRDVLAEYRAERAKIAAP